MTTFEYASVASQPDGTVLQNSTGATGADAAEVGDNAGAAGWEAYGFAFTPGGQVVTVFKRPTGTI